jgi:hypothetical protein
MAELKQLPEFDTLETLVEWFDTTDLGEYLDQLPRVQVDVMLTQTNYWIAVEPALMTQLRTVAQTQHLSTERLVNVWLAEKLSQTV